MPTTLPLPLIIAGAMTTWIETYRGTVYRWELDNVDHFTVAFYFQRFADATLGLLEPWSWGLPTWRAPGGAVPVDAYVRYLRELRVGDLLHVESGVIAVEDGDIVTGHRLFDSGGGVVRHRRIAHAPRGPGGARSGAAQCEAAAAPARRRWPGTSRPGSGGRPAGDDGLRGGGREFVKPWEIDAFGQCAMSFYVHRFAAANGHAIAAFGMTPAYQRDCRRGYSTFEFQLEFPGRAPRGGPVVVRADSCTWGRRRSGCSTACPTRTGEMVATLDQFGVHLDMDERRPAPLPDVLSGPAPMRSGRVHVTEARRKTT